MEIIFLGTSCMVPTKERNHSSIYVNYKGEGILIDCGEGTQRQLKIAGIKPTKITKIFITHWHGDHVLGLPGLLQTMNASDYEKKLDIYGPKGTKIRFEHMFKTFLFNIKFEHSINEIKQGSLELKDLFVNFAELDHGIPCLGYNLIEKDRRRIKISIVKSLGIPDGPLLGELQNNKKIKWKNKTISPKDTTYIVKGKKVSFILDTVLCNNIYDLAQDSDLLICEASYTDNLIDKADEYKHLTAKQAALIATQTNSSSLILTHLSQRYKTPEKLLEEASDIFKDIKIAYDFMKIKV